MIRYNSDMDGYVVNWAQLPDVGDARTYDGPLPENWQEDYMHCREVDGVMTLNEEKKAAAEAQAAAEAARRQEIEELTAWLADYDQQAATFERCVRLGIPCDIDMDALNAEATVKHARLMELVNPA